MRQLAGQSRLELPTLLLFTKGATQSRAAKYARTPSSQGRHCRAASWLGRSVTDPQDDSIFKTTGKITRTGTAVSRAAQPKLDAKHERESGVPKTSTPGNGTTGNEGDIATTPSSNPELTTKSASAASWKT